MMTPDEKARELAFLKECVAAPNEFWDLSYLIQHYAENVAYWQDMIDMDNDSSRYSLNVCEDMRDYNEHKLTLAETYKALTDELAQQKAALCAFGTLEEYKNNVKAAQNRIAELEKEIEEL